MKIVEPNLTFSGQLTSRQKTDLIILHHAAASRCSVYDVHKWHLEKKWFGIGYHYFVSKDGMVFRGRPENVVGAHCEGQNNRSIGICAEGNFTTEEMPFSQKQAIVALLRYLLGRYPNVVIKKHSDFNPTDCPGEKYPFEEIVAEASSWSPEAEIEKLFESGLINSIHKPNAPVTWGELATVLNRIKKGV